MSILFSTVFTGNFKRDNRLFWWILVLQVYSWIAHSFMLLPFLALFIPMEAVIAYSVLLVTEWLPIIVVEAVAGSFVGYKIYGRVEKILE